MLSRATHDPHGTGPALGILIIEENRNVRDRLRTELEARGCRVTATNNKVEGLQAPPGRPSPRPDRSESQLALRRTPPGRVAVPHPLIDRKPELAL